MNCLFSSVKGQTLIKDMFPNEYELNDIYIKNI